MTQVIELFGYSTEKDEDWDQIVEKQVCVFTGTKCFKVRKSEPDTAIGSCAVLYGKPPVPIIICPNRFLARRQVFTDSLHLLTTHDPGNELHIVSEVPVPGGSVDYFLLSARNGKVKDFVGIELQGLDTVGTVWPARQRLLARLGVPRKDDAENSDKKYGINWKMTAKTTLVQMHHKVQTFEHVHKKLILVLQDKLLAYMCREFDFSHVRAPAAVGDCVHFHAYTLTIDADQSYKLVLQSRSSTDAEGIGACLGLQAEARVELQQIVRTLEAKISQATLFSPA